MNAVLPTRASRIEAREPRRAAPSVAPAKARLSIFGLGYVGAVSAGCFADLGFQVIGVDPDLGKLEKIRAGNSPIVEPGLDELLGRSWTQGRVLASDGARSAVEHSDVSMICVGTPTGSDGRVDFTFLDEVCSQVGAALAAKDDYHLVVIRSTVPAGTTAGRLLPILEGASGKTCGEDFGLCFNPEFLRESTAVSDFFNPPKTVIGAFDEQSGQLAMQLYDGIDGRVIRASIEAAEMVKYVDNTWHAVKVSFGNEVGKLCKAVGIDSHEVMDIFVLDHKLNLSAYYLKPGFAFGGSCLPKDVRGITVQAKDLALDTPLLNSIMASNRAHIDHALRIIEGLDGRIGFLGLTFKANTDDLRESPVLELMAALRRNGRDVVAYDPNLRPGEPMPGHAAHLRHGGGLADMADALPLLLHWDADSLAADCDVIVVSHATDEFRAAASGRPDRHVVDLVRLGIADRSSDTYHGICW